MSRTLRGVVSDEGLPIVTEREALTDEDWQGPNPGGLDWYLHQLEQIWRPHAAAAGPLQSVAAAVLARVREIRLARQQGQLERVGLAALHVGRLHTAAWYRHNLGDEMVLGRKIRRKNTAIARLPRTDADDTPIVKEAQRLRQGRPYSREHSTRWLAEQIALLQVVPYAASTIRARLKVLGIR